MQDKREENVEFKCRGSFSSLGNSSMTGDAILKDSCNESTAMTTMASSQRSAEVSSTQKYERRKRQKTGHSVIKSNVKTSGVLRDTFSTEPSTLALDMHSHPIQYLSMDPVTRKSFAGRNFSQERNKIKEQNIPIKASEGSNAEHDLHEVSRIPCLVVANTEPFGEECASAVVKSRPVQGVSDECFNPEDKNAYVKNTSLMKKCGEPVVYHVTQKFQKLKTYARKERVNTSSRRNSNYSNSDGPLTVDLVDKKTEVSRDEVTSNADDIADLSLISTKDVSGISHFSLGRIITSHSKKKLLVLDVSGLLADFVSQVPSGYKPDIEIPKRSVFKRPFCEDFLRFCLDKFHVGIWSSRVKKNVDTVIELIMGNSASKLLFCWNQSHCTRTKFCTVEKKTKPILLKELRRLWEKLEPGLPWEKGEFNESNTLLLDDSPYKALLNPGNTAIFPYPYKYSDTRDRSLGPGGDLRVYLEGLAMAENVQEYVASHPFGQRAITKSNPSWRYYQKVILQVNTLKDAGTSFPSSE